MAGARPDVPFAASEAPPSADADAASMGLDAENIPRPPRTPMAMEPPEPEDRSREDTAGDEGDGSADVAPVGPTEYATGPESVAGVVDTPSAAGLEAATPSATGDAPMAPASVEQLAQQIKDLEARLDEMIGQGAPPANGADTASERGQPHPPGPSGRATARELLPEEYYLRQWGRAGRRQRVEEVDDFGHDPKYEARFQPFFDFLYKTYFRVETSGIQNVPAQGRCLIVANHSGGPLPYDGIMLRTTIRNEHVPRELRWLAEDFVYHLPFIGTAMNRLGAVRACQENAERLLAQGKLVAVFPEGAKGIGKLFRERYRLQRFGRGGFIRLCLRTQTPIVPAAIVGAEEANPMLYRIEYMTKALGVPYLPITPTFPALGPLGLLPAPTKWSVTFGEPIDFDAYGPEAVDDDLLVGRLAEKVRGTIQGMLDRGLERRRSIWFG